MLMDKDIKIFADIDKACQSQIDAICSSPAFEGQKVRIMPDAHSGKNSVVGFTSTVGDKVIPNIVGGDIGCGVLAVKLKRPKKGLDFAKLDKAIRANVPFGIGSINDAVIADFDYEALSCWDALPGKHLIPRSLGSLGAGNHFIEIDKDASDAFWLVVHTGSRNLGTQIAEYYQGLAGQRIGEEIDPSIPYAMAYLEGQQMESYLHDMDIAVQFSNANRSQIAKTILKSCGLKEVDRIESTHNYIDTAAMIIRKGAIEASSGVPVIIPLNMAEGCLIGEGRGNSDWNCSAPHGTGRSKTRSEARETISMSEFKKAMDGVWSSCVAQDTVDESPQAYKDSSVVIEAAKESIAVVEVMESAYNFKAPGTK